MADDLVAEEWRPVEGLAGYEASSLGRLRSWKPSGPGRQKPTEPRIITGRICQDGHVRAKISANGKQTSVKIARLVCIAFHGSPVPLLDHCLMAGEDKTDCRPSNVFWGTIMVPVGRTCKIDGCDEKVAGKGWCSAHYQMWYHHGDPLGGRTKPGTLLAWIDDHVAFSDGDCLIWPFGTQAAGYGRLAYGGRARGAHEVMCEKAHGEPPQPKMDAAHSCGNGHLGCVNPRHLRWATRLENIRDKEAHGTVVKGESATNSKLTDTAVIWMRRNFEQMKKADMARKYGVTFMTVTAALRGKSWKHLNAIAPPPVGA